mgnify:CR=1 FL=1
MRINHISKFYILSILLLGFTSTSMGQGFMDSLRIESEKIYPNSKIDTFDLDHFNQDFFISSKVQMNIRSSGQYQIMFIHETGWTHTYGSDDPWTYKQAQQESQILNLTDSTSISKTLVLRCEEAKIYSGQELIYGLGFLVPKNDNYPVVHSFPVVYERNDPLNRRWTFFENDTHMVLRYVHSYPHGNQTSFYHEIVIYFKRLD